MMNYELFGYRLGKIASILLKPGLPRMKLQTAKKFVSQEIFKPKLIEQFKRQEVPKVRIPRPF
jgi:hypothetical protein